MRRLSATRWLLAMGAMSLLVGGFIPPGPATATGPFTQRQFLTRLAQSPVSKWLSVGGQTSLRLALGTKPQPVSGVSVPSTDDTAATAPAVAGAKASVSPGLTNVRVNTPAGDAAAEPDMTTQSETSVAAHGSNVVVAYNDDGRSAFFLSPVVDFSGYSWSSDGGATFHDSVLPNRLPALNVGDPIVAADRSGRFYYASLASAPLSVPVVVGTSTNGGKTFSSPITVSSKSAFDFTDKPWMTVGPDPSDPSKDDVYVSWTDFFFECANGRCTFGTRIELSVSRDGGTTFSSPTIVVQQPDQVDRTEFAFVQGSSISVDPNTGAVYVAWERFANPFGDRRFDYPDRAVWVARSDDSGMSFSQATRAGDPVPIGSTNFICGNVLRFGRAQLVRVQEFPSLAVGPSGTVYVGFDTGVQGRSLVFVARSSDGGATWQRSPVNPTEFTDQFMPSIVADGGGVHVLYYQRATSRKLATVLSSSNGGPRFGAAEQVSTETFGVPFTLPNFDPAIALCYMGDYISLTSDGASLHAAWGDNRNTVTDGLYPDGRLDPNVFYAKP